jgi:hypothetical protein
MLRLPWMAKAFVGAPHQGGFREHLAYNMASYHAAKKWNYASCGALTTPQKDEPAVIRRYWHNRLAHLMLDEA